jgi:thiosulfate/3-mercaptopyruvate sulfurtransferase
MLKILAALSSLLFAVQTVEVITGTKRTLVTLAQSSGYARPDLLVETDWLAGNLTNRAIRIVDLRPNGYEAGHIPGAVHLENAAIRDPKRAPSFVPAPDDFEALMRRLGITNGTRVIAYDERGGIYAARLWWILNYYGHSNVALLNGGWTKWIHENRPTTIEPPSLLAVTFTARAMPQWLATADDVVAAAKESGTKIIDARTAAEIDGRDLRGIKRGGAVPGSIPVYWEDGLTEARTFKPAPEIRALFESRGIVPAHEVIAYCQVGMRASVDLFMLKLIGYDKLRNYYGAWEEWGNRDDLPVKK